MKFREVTPTSSHSTLYSYDNDNRVTQLKYNGSQTIGYTRDTLGRVTTRTATNTDVHKTTYEYVAGGYGEDSTTKLVSAVNHMSGADALRLRFAYTYDNRGNITSESRKGVMTYYEYDALGQFVWEKSNHDNRAWKYEYDRGGNILKKTKYKFENNTVGDVVQTINYGYDSAWKDKLVSYNGKTITYDEIGNPLNDGTWSYEWQHGRQLKKMTRGADSVEFKYDHNGMRVEKVATIDGVTETTQYYYHGKKLMRQVKGNHVLHFYYDAEGKPAMVMYNGTMYTYAHSLQGDIAAIVDSAGNLVVEYKYDAWGNITTSFGSLNSTLGKLNPFRYRGYVYDVENALYYLNKRYYMAGQHRFINCDVLITKNKLLQTNMWSYCCNAPVGCIDSDGMCIADCKGLQILFHWLGGTGEDLICDSASWGEYMRKDEQVNDIVFEFVEATYQECLRKPGETVYKEITVDAETSRDTVFPVGYGYLHGTLYLNMSISATVYENNGFSYSVNCEWKDQINPNMQYPEDRFWSGVSHTLLNPKDYWIYVRWNVNSSNSFEKYQKYLKQKNRNSSQNHRSRR